MKKLDIIDKFMFFINSILGVLLLITYVIPFIDPEKLSLLSLLSLIYPLIMIANLVFVGYWMIKLKPQFLLSLAIIIVGYKPLQQYISIEDKKEIKNSDIKIVSFNVRRFNQYEWIKNPNFSENLNTFFNHQLANIICLQEHINDDKIKIDLPNSYIKHRNGSGLAIYTSYPILKKRTFNFEKSSNNAIYVDLKINQDTLRIYNIHLQSFNLLAKKKKPTLEEKIQLFKEIFVLQAQQVKRIKESIALCPYKNIVVGDFNNTAFSWHYKQLIENKQDAFVQAGFGLGSTFKYLSPLRIDFILVDDQLTVNYFKKFDVLYSDHKPIVARINFENNEE